MKLNNKSAFWINVIIWMAVFAGLCFLLLSCDVLKKSSSKKDDFTTLSKSNSSAQDTGHGGNIAKTSSISKEDFDWWKTTVISGSPQRKDTLSPVTNVYPSTVIYEGGKGSKEANVSTFDSSWFKNALAMRDERIDSLSKVKHEDTSSKKTTTDWKLYAIIALAVFFFVDKTKNYLPFKIVRK